MLSLQAKFLVRKEDEGVVPDYGNSPTKIGREHLAQEVLAYGDALYFNPPEQNR